MWSSPGYDIPTCYLLIANAALYGTLHFSALEALRNALYKFKTYLLTLLPTVITAPHNGPAGTSCTFWAYLLAPTDEARCWSSAAAAESTAAVVAGVLNCTLTARPGATARLDCSSPGHSRITAFFTPCRNELEPDGDEDEELDAVVPRRQPVTRSSVIDVT